MRMERLRNVLLTAECKFDKHVRNDLVSLAVDISKAAPAKFLDVYKETGAIIMLFPALSSQGKENEANKNIKLKWVRMEVC